LFLCENLLFLVPVPLVDLAFFHIKLQGDLSDICPVPILILLKQFVEHLLLLFVLPKSSSELSVVKAQLHHF